MPHLAEIVAKQREKLGLSQSELARMVGVKPQSIQQLEAGAVARPRYINELGRALGVDLIVYTETGEIIPIEVKASRSPTSNVAPAPAPVPGVKDLKVYASAEGGPDGMLLSYEPIEWIERPESLRGVPGAFAMYVVNDSMEPKYRQGDLLLIHPSSPVRRGDSVLCVKTADDHEHSALVKELVSADAGKVVLKQYNPLKTFRIPKGEIQGLHLVIGAIWRR